METPLSSLDNCFFLVGFSFVCFAWIHFIKGFLHLFGVIQQVRVRMAEPPVELKPNIDESGIVQITVLAEGKKLYWVVKEAVSTKK
ncbi:hypothetical protein QL285_070535 [Trifolium repens]|nr:hypothetical protein QL285_070535 [Trifolium repens]